MRSNGCLMELSGLIVVVITTLTVAVWSLFSSPMDSIFSEVLREISASSPADSTVPAVNYNEIPQSRTEDGAFVLGYEDAPITIVQFADFLCPHCQNYKPTVDQLIETYVVTGQAKFEFRAFPVIDETNSPFMVNLAICADEQVESGFWIAHDTLYELISGGWYDKIGRDLAQRMNLDYSVLSQCISQSNQVEVDQELGYWSGVNGTPGIRVRYNDGFLEALPGYERGGVPFDALEEAILEANYANEV